MAGDAPLAGAQEWRVSGRAVLALLALALLVPLVLLWPSLRWAYNIERAGALMDAGMAWPEPRRIDSLPALVDGDALRQALVYLQRAQRIRPDDDHAYRMAGHAHMALGEWQLAVASLNRAHANAPDNPVLLWESGLVYEQIEQIVGHAPHTSIMTDLATGEVSVEGFRVYAPYCYPGQTQRCYVEEATIERPFAAFPKGLRLRERALIVYDQAAISVTLEVPQRQPALTFMAGLGPGRSGAAQPATYQLWLAQPDLPATQIFSATLDRATARRGWQFHWVDLSRWAGQRVTLRFDTLAGQRYRDGAEHYVWADVEFTSRMAARFGAMMPAARKVRSWSEAGLDTAQFIARGDEARLRRREKEARLWYQRAEDISPR